MKAMSEADRALIDAAVAAGKITKVAPGVAVSMTYPVWDGKALVYPDHEQRVKAAKQALFSGAAKPSDPKVKLRRKRVAEAHAEGKTIGEIAEVLDCSYRQVWNDLQALQLSPNPVKPQPAPPEDPRIATRRARIVAMAEGGSSIEQIASEIALPVSTARAIAAAIGVKFPKKPRPSRAKLNRGPKLSARVIALREQIAECVAKGMTQASICEALHISRETLRYNLHRMDVSLCQVPTGTVTQREKRRDDRREQVQALTAEGLTLAQICSRLDARKWLIQSDMRALGLEARREAPRARVRRRGSVYGPVLPIPRTLEKLERQKEVARLHGEGMGRAEIRAALGIKPHVLRHDLRDLGLSLPREDHGVKAYGLKKADITAARRDRVRAAAGRGLSFAEVSAELCIPPGTLRKDYVALGLSARAKRRPAGQIDQLRALRSEGLSIGAIAARLDLSKSTVHRICQGLDLPNPAWRAAA